MKKKLLGIGVAGIAFLLLSVATLVPVTATPATVKIVTTTPETALPYFLEGTILDGNTRVLVTEDGQPYSYIDSTEYDIIISWDEQEQIIDNARDEYMDKYDVDPYPPEPERPAYFLPSKLGIDTVTPSTTGNSPHQIGGYMVLIGFVARDSAHRPSNPSNLINQVHRGWYRFGQFNIRTYNIFFWGFWSAGNVGNDAHDILRDFKQDCRIFQNRDNQVLMGLVRNSNHNGIAYTFDFFCIVVEDCFPNYPKDGIAQHEITHCIAGIYDTTWPWEHGWRSCVMNYWYLFFGAKNWCSPCSNKVYNMIWQ